MRLFNAAMIAPAVIPGGGSVSFRLAPGDALRVTDPEGLQAGVLTLQLADSVLYSVCWGWWHCCYAKKKTKPPKKPPIVAHYCFVKEW